MTHHSSEQRSWVGGGERGCVCVCVYIDVNLGYVLPAFLLPPVYMLKVMYVKDKHKQTGAQTHTL